MANILITILISYILAPMKGVKGVLLLAGKGERFNSLSFKQFHILKGKKIYLWALEPFISSKLFEEIILVCPKKKVEEVQAEVGPTCQVVPGGETRQESSYLGLLACGSNTEVVVIHDGVRPFVSQRILEENITQAKKFGAVDTCIPSTDTLVYSEDGEEIAEIPKRSHFWRGQTPQSFSYPLILEAHQKTTQKNATDDCSLVLEFGKSVHLVQGEETNFKITTRLDLFIAESMIEEIPSLK